MDILITGGSGFIGRALIARLLEQGHTVLVLDTNPILANSPRLEFVSGDVRDATLVSKLVQKADAVFHLAAIVGVSTYVERPLDVLDVGYTGTINVARACATFDVPMIFSSSSEVLGKNQMPLNEESDCIYGSPSKARWSYALSKSVGEQLLHAMGPQGLQYAITRFFNIYGAGMDGAPHGRVVGQFVEAIRNKVPLRVYGDGSSIRTFCYIDDTTNALSQLLTNLVDKNPNVVGKTFHIGRSEPTPIITLARHMVRLSAHSQGIEHHNPEDIFGTGFEEIDRRVPEVTALKEAIGFVATTDLQTGLNLTLQAEGLLAENPASPPPAKLPWIRPKFHVSTHLLNTIGGLLQSGMVTNGGAATDALEQRSAEILGTPHAIAVSSGSMALRLAAHALRPNGPATAVLPSFTFLATANALVHANYNLVFCDVDPNTWTLCPNDLKKILDTHSDVKLVVPVNAYGIAPDMAEITTLAINHGAKVLYDDAHGLGTQINGSPTVNQVDARCISLHATKTLSAIEGGLIGVFDSTLAETLKTLRGHGLKSDLKQSIPGFNGRIDNIRATVALNEFERMDQILANRRKTSQRIRAFINTHCTPELVTQVIPDHVTSSSTNIVVGVPCAKTRGMDFVIEFLSKRSIATRRYFWPPIHQMEYFTCSRPLPVTEHLADTLISLPFHTNMASDEIKLLESALVALARECRA